MFSETLFNSSSASIEFWLIAIVDFEVNLPLEESLFVFDKEKYFEELNYYENIID